jgi:hypothetical protein
VEFVIAAIFGLSGGTLLAYTTVPTTRWLPSAAATLVLLIGAGEAAWSPSGSPWSGIIIVFSSAIATILAMGVLWAHHPLLAGSGYWSRVLLATLHERTLQRSWAEYARAEGQAQRGSSHN